MDRSDRQAEIYEDFFSATARSTAIVTGTGEIISLNPALERLLGKAEREVVGRAVPVSGALKLSSVRQLTGEYYLDDGIRPVQVMITSIPVGNDVYALEFERASHDRRRTDAMDANFIADQVPSGIIYSLNSGVRLSYANQAAGEIFGVPPNKLTADRWLDYISASERSDVQDAIISVLEGKHASVYLHPTKQRTIELQMSPYRQNNGLCGAWVGVLNDISEMKNRELDLEFVATHDSLTGLRNALAFHDFVDSKFRNQEGFIIAFCDINGFKAINDDLGHMFGDRVLTEVANRLRETEFDVFRYGGDEFILVGDGDAIDVEEKVNALFQRPLKARGVEIMVGISVGMCSTEDASTIDEIMDQADHKMYKQKKATKQENAVKKDAIAGQ
jgi:diguanylate cyclase (GGDEF)-like protein/PAS domain S-box-containing protein